MADKTDNFKTSFKSRNAKSDMDNSALLMGKVQPQAIPLEEVIVGALMLDKDALPSIMDLITSKTFYLESHQIIYKSILRLFEKSAPIDLLTVTEELKQSGELSKIGGALYLAKLTNKVVSSANIEYHARIIAQKYIQRELIRISTETIKDAFEDTTDVFDLLDKAEQNLFSVTENNLSKGTESFSSVAAITIQQIEAASEQNNDGLTGVPTGFTDLDAITSGWQPSDLIIVAARPSMGKTAFTLALARNAAVQYDRPVAIFSLEMSNVQLVQRLLSMESEIQSDKLRSGKMEDYEWQQLHSTVEKMDNVPIFVDDTPGINIFELRAKCRRLKMKSNISMVIIDYLQLMTGGSEASKGNREQEISAISRALKSLAKELNIPVIALSQLSRAVETRGGDKRPMLSDLRESGAIEQDADIVSFIYRPEYYGILEDEEGNNLKGTAEIILAKHRNGAVGSVKLKWTADFAKFENLGDPNFSTFPSIDDANSTSITMKSRGNIDDEDIPF